MHHQIKVSAVLDGLMRSSRESEACFKAWAERTSDEALRRLLAYRARICTRNEAELLAMRAELGETTCDAHPLQSTPKFRRWSEVGRMIRSVSERGLFSVCEAEDSRALVRYRDALEYRLPEAVHKLLARQFTDLIDQHARLQRIRAYREAKAQQHILMLNPQT